MGRMGCMGTVWHGASMVQLRGSTMAGNGTGCSGNGMEGMSGINTVHGLAEKEGWLRYEGKIQGRFLSTIIGLSPHLAGGR